ncbi:hypothetical protein BTJ40_04130 [Microbulbifer sp. A4B17]|uniref:hypothetical protein n=1 Tax=Microbulbifer sp. A4B17 TaxID=359370 RepID=UPI000D52A87E|nr:hypothetical protein [Microbulbifer sp. A4B17]AWF80070.1 hypothetical protein BTJ40_04130 [Microbulbifer sp. A4B17]
MPTIKKLQKFGLFPALLLLLLLLLLNMPLQAQVNCSSNNDLRVCGLEDSHTLDYESDPKEIQFTTRSLLGSWTLRYDVEVTPLSGSTFSLFADSGEQLDIDLSFRANNGSTETLTPGNQSNTFAGTSDDADTYLVIELDSNQVPSSSRYSASFEMTLNNYFFIWTAGTETVQFDIELEVEPSITIRNLGDVDLSNSGTLFGQSIEGSEDFCVGGIGFSSYTVNLSSANGSTGGGGSNAYELGGSSEQIPYSVAFSDNLGATSGVSPGSLGDVPGSFSRTEDESCLSDNARIYISVAPSDWENASEPFYTDVLTVTVSSQ